MKTGLELYTRTAVPINPGYELAMEVLFNGRILEGSASKDTYEFSSTITGGKRLAAIGRKRRYDYRDLAGIFEADGAVPQEIIFVDDEDDIKLHLETNIWLDPGEMVQCLSLKLYSESAVLEIPLIRPDIKTAWLKRGCFVIDIGDFVRELYNRRGQIRKIF